MISQKYAEVGRDTKVQAYITLKASIYRLADILTFYLYLNIQTDVECLFARKEMKKKFQLSESTRSTEGLKPSSNVHSCGSLPALRD